MAKEAILSVTFTAGCAINRDMYYVASSPDAWREAEDTPYSVMYFYQHQTEKKWFYHELPDWNVVSVCYRPPVQGAERIVHALTEDGYVETYSRSGSSTENLLASLSDDDSELEYLTQIRCVDGALLVCGDAGRIYWKEQGAWTRIDQDLAARVSDSGEVGPSTLLLLNDVGVANDGTIVTVGSDGFIAYFDRKQWRVEEKLTGSQLNRVQVESDGTLWIAGSQGTVLTGKVGTKPTVVTRKTLKTDLYAVTVFQGVPYFGGEAGVFKYVDGKLEPIVIDGVPFTEVVVELEAKDGVLWLLSAKKILRFDGSDWETFEHPGNIDPDTRRVMGQ
ncbi:hypothetical protein NOF55_22640 [Rhizobiaceae bacterium BDR2-2]|uniref:Uncharacterized protein n=1 Tax=Ectorhizobium quercum TaxID=2965071 RepID=A0AAE3SX59_9HYPH|nr:hypothetical protein [Ectorhizobium quercum]MCX8999907.1 hypothetical protein [Ectorhizobium quercum]